MTGPGQEGDWPGETYPDEDKPQRRRVDVLDELEGLLRNTRAGTSDSDVNALALPIATPIGVIIRSIEEIKRLRVPMAPAGPSFRELKHDIMTMEFKRGPSV